MPALRAQIACCASACEYRHAAEATNPDQAVALTRDPRPLSEQPVEGKTKGSATRYVPEIGQPESLSSATWFRRYASLLLERNVQLKREGAGILSHAEEAELYCWNPADLEIH